MTEEDRKKKKVGKVERHSISFKINCKGVEEVKRKKLETRREASRNRTARKNK